MVLPPNHLYSARVHNKTSKPVVVTVHYQALDLHSEQKTETIAAGAEFLFDKVTFSADGGSSLSVAPIQSISAKFEDGADAVTQAPSVTGVVDVKDFDLVEDGTLKVNQL